LFFSFFDLITIKYKREKWGRKAPVHCWDGCSHVQLLFVASAMMAMNIPTKNSNGITDHMDARPLNFDQLLPLVFTLPYWFIAIGSKNAIIIIATTIDMMKFVSDDVPSSLCRNLFAKNLA